MTQIFITDCTLLVDKQQIQTLLPLLDDTRQRKINTLTSVKKQAQVAAAGLLLVHRFGCDAVYDYTESGKPYLLNDSHQFCISHSERWVVLAVSEHNIGVDIQIITPIRPKVLSRCFTSQEQAYVSGDALRFTELWTAKEAYGKYTGRGITPPFPPSAPPAEILQTTQSYENAVITLVGDDTAEIIPIIIKDLL